MNKINESICRAINIIAKRIVDNAHYDRTISGTIVEVIENEQQTYRVKVGEALYRAQPIGNTEYKNGDMVYILIPQNDNLQTKFILGKM